MPRGGCSDRNKINELDRGRRIPDRAQMTRNYV